ncbi:MAG: hypothetical protein ACK4R6_06360 [Spirosomataceae bacterium]
MIQEIIFRKVNNFWIDNGIVGLFKVLENIRENAILDESENIIEYDISLSSNFLKVELLNPSIVEIGVDEVHPNLLKVLNEAKNKVVTSYLTATNNAGWLLKDGKFDVYRKNDFKMHLKSFFTGKTPKTEGGVCIPFIKKDVEEILQKNNINFSKDKNSTITLENRFFKKYKSKKEGDFKNIVVPNLKKEDFKASDRLMSDDEFILFLNFIEENSLLSIEDNKPTTLTGRGFLNSQPQYEIGANFESIFLQIGDKPCSFSNEKVKVADVITGMDYPFSTGKSGEMNFASNLEKKPNISAKYSYVALFSFFQLHYQLQDKIKNYFVLYDSNLKELSNFYNSIQINLANLKNSNFCNFEVFTYNLELEAETLFNFAISVFKQTKGKLNKDERKKIYTKSIFTFTNDGNIFRDVKEYTSLSSLFDLFDAFDETDDEKFNFDHFLNFIRFFTKKMQTSKGEQYDTTWRNRLCNDLLHFRSIAETIEWFFGEVKLKEKEPNSIFNLDKIISVYNNKTQLNMKTEMVEMCKSIGNRIGRYCRDANNGNGDKGILYSIRNSKNRIEFLNTLAESQFKTGVSYGEDFFKTLPDSPQWEEYKALVSIFAMNSFLYKPEAKLN